MLRASIRIPILHCTQQYDENGNSEPYLWLAYFWGDATSLASTNPISVFVPNVSDTRAQYPDNIGNNRDILIPTEVGEFAVHLEGGGSNLTMLGVLAVLFEEDDTHSDAIAAGYDAFRIAVSRELNNYVKTKGPIPPNNDDIKKIVSAIHNSVYDAVADKEGWWSGFWGNQDDYIGYSHTLFLGLPEPDPPTVVDLGLPPIDADAFKIVFESTNPFSFEVKVVKAGHNHYEFIRAQLRLSTVPNVCDPKVKAFAAATETLKKLRDQRNKLKARLAQTPEQQSIRQEIANLKNSEIPTAESALNAAAGALRDCHVLTSIASITGNKPEP